VGQAMLRIVEGKADRFILESADINRLGQAPFSPQRLHRQQAARLCNSSPFEASLLNDSRRPVIELVTAQI
jgi:hypothetical protein